VITTTSTPAKSQGLPRSWRWVQRARRAGRAARPTAAGQISIPPPTRLEERHYTRNQVILWQGDIAEYLYLIKFDIPFLASLPSPAEQRLDNLPAVIEYVESLKDELKQEAMALEVNQKLMLI